MARNRQRAKERKQRQQQDPESGPPADDLVALPAMGGAPPSDLGTVRPVGFHDSDDDDDDDDDDDVEPKDDGGGAVAAPAPSRKGGLRRIPGFIRACWAELQRVQWPDRKQVGQATAVVLGFVVIAGAFLGVADIVAQRIVNFIL